MNEPEYWAEVEEAWEGRSTRPAPRRPARGAGTAMLAAAMLGLAEVLEPPKRDEVVVEVDADQPVEPVDGVLLHFDPSPRRTVAVLTSVGVERSLRSETISAVTPPA